MGTQLPVLRQIEIASPCTASWEQMQGDDRVRYCGECKLNVYNLAALSQDEVERLIVETEGRLCGRIYRRADGTVMTRDCPVGFAALRRRLAGLVGRIAAVVVFAGGLFGMFHDVAAQNTAGLNLARIQPFAAIQRWLDPSAVRPPVIALGEIVCPTPPPAPPASSSPPAPPSR